MNKIKQYTWLIWCIITVVTLIATVIFEEVYGSIEYAGINIIYIPAVVISLIAIRMQK